MQVNIYIECDNSFQETEKKYGYVLQCFTKKGERTREGFGKLTGTIHKVTLHAILKALERMKQPSEINIYTKNTYIANMFDHYLPDWAMHDFKKSGNEPIVNAAEWKKLWELSQEHHIEIIPGKHEFSEWILEEANRRSYQ